MIPHKKTPRENLMTAGQPTYVGLSELAERGFTDVVNLRPKDEMGGRDEAAEVLSLGMNYTRIPVAGPGDVTFVAARKLGVVLDGAEGGVLVHCASSNRVGALFALLAFDEGAELEEAIQQGLAAGLASLEPKVRQLMASR